MIPDGWTLYTEQFDYGRLWGVGVRGERGNRAVRTAPGLTEQEAIAEATPVLSEWIARKH